MAASNLALAQVIARVCLSLLVGAVLLALFWHALLDRCEPTTSRFIGGLVAVGAAAILMVLIWRG